VTAAQTPSGTTSDRAVGAGGRIAHRRAPPDGGRSESALRRGVEPPLGAGAEEPPIVLTDGQLGQLADFVAARVIAGLDGTATSAPATPEPPRIAFQRREAAAALSVGVDTFDRHIRPQLRCVYVGDVRLWRVAELERWLAERAMMAGTTIGAPATARTAPGHGTGGKS
jgi:hypothetical protein